MILESLVDYVMQRGNQHYGQFSHKQTPNTQTALFNHRRLLEYLFQDNETSSFWLESRQGISELKYSEISTQLYYISQKMHSELNRKHLEIDGVLYKLENDWLRKKIPEFYRYYFLKFASANPYSKMQMQFVQEIEHISQEKDTYTSIRKTIDARETCLANLRRELASISVDDIEQSLETLRTELQEKRRKAIMNQQQGYTLRKKSGDEDQQTGKSWKDNIQVVLEMISHLRKLTGFVTDLIKNWRNKIYEMNEDPNRFRERVIFYHHDANYLIKMIFDNRFITQSVLNQYFTFGNHYDPFLLKPAMILESKKAQKSEDEEILLFLIKPSELEMDKITKALVILAQQEYDQDEQSRFLNQRKNFGELEYRKKLIQRKRGPLSRSNTSLPKQQSQKTTPFEKQQISKFSTDKKSDYTQKQLEQVQNEKNQLNTRSRIQSSLNRVRNIRSMDLKKVSPYVNSNPNLIRNERAAKAQKVVEIEQKFRMAQKQYAEANTKKKQIPEDKNLIVNQEWSSSQKEIMNNKFFNRYIEQNLKIMEEANKKAFTNHRVPPKRNGSQRSINSLDKKQIQYIAKLQYGPNYKDPKNQIILKNQSLPQQIGRNYGSKGTKAIIEISDKGVRKNQNIIDYQLTGAKGKNMADILANSKRADEMRMLEDKLNPFTKQSRKQKEKKQREDDLEKYQLSKSKVANLYETQQLPEVIVVRQEPQKIEEIKKFLYDKIKEELASQFKKDELRRAQQLEKMLEVEKRRQHEAELERIRIQQQRRRQEQQKRRLAQLQKERRKIAIQIRTQPIQCSAQEAFSFYNKIFRLQKETYSKLFLREKDPKYLQKILQEELHIIFLRGFLGDEEVSYGILRFDWRHQKCRRLIFEYAATKDQEYFMASFHSFCEYLWKNDPVLEIVITARKDFGRSDSGMEAFEDLYDYASRRGHSVQILEQQKQKKQNIDKSPQQQQNSHQVQQAPIEIYKHTWTRPQEYLNLQFPYTHYYFGNKFSIKCQLLTTDFALEETIPVKINQTAELTSCYIYLLVELFRRHLTPEDMVEFREHCCNFRRLKDIFKIILDIQKNDPQVQQLRILLTNNFQQLNQQLKDLPNGNKYLWENFKNKQQNNRTIMLLLQFQAQLDCSINLFRLEGRRFLRINRRGQTRVLKSTIYPKDNVYIFDTDTPRIKMFFMDAEHYKLMKTELFIFLVAFFNNIIGESQQQVESFWTPQFAITGNNSKEIRRVTDFNLSMKKGLYLSEDVFFACNDYIPNGLQAAPSQHDVVFMEAVIVGFLHEAVEEVFKGLPIYAKLIDAQEMF